MVVFYNATYLCHIVQPLPSKQVDYSSCNTERLKHRASMSVLPHHEYRHKTESDTQLKQTKDMKLTTSTSFSMRAFYYVVACWEFFFSRYIICRNPLFLVGRQVFRRHLLADRRVKKDLVTKFVNLLRMKWKRWVVLGIGCWVQFSFQTSILEAVCLTFSVTDGWVRMRIAHRIWQKGHVTDPPCLILIGLVNPKTW